MKKLLLVVDFQHDFVEGTLGFEQAKTLEQKITKKIQEYRAQGYEVAFTFDTHTQDYLSTREGRHLPIAHCVKGTLGWELYGTVAHEILATDRRFEKATFGSMEVARYLAENAYDSIEIVGLVSNICVLANAVLALTALPQATVSVDASCTASFAENLHAAALDIMTNLHIVVSNRTN